MREDLYEVINDGEKLVLLDGTVWRVLGDPSLVVTWLPTDELEITERDDGGYEITRLETGVTVSVVPETVSVVPE